MTVMTVSMRDILLLFVVLPFATAQSNFRVGVGLADITGLVSEGALYGYANPNQDARGLHLRQYSRAFVFESAGTRAALVVTDTTMISGGLHKHVMERLEELYGGQYSAENVMLAPQHSHGAPGGYNTYYMYQIPSLGYINETANAAIDGIVASIERAHDNLQEGDVYLNFGDLLDTNLNRSPYAYDNNPQAEKDRYPYNVDKQMSVLKVVGALGEDLGMASFFAVHTTSMKNYNHLVSTDNKGYAAHMYEREMNPGTMPGEAEFVAAFAQTAEGDASPNLDGSRCVENDVVCAYNTSTCVENWEDPALCTGRGPAGEQFEDTRIIGERQYLKAKELYDTATERLQGVVDYRFAWVNMSDVVADIGGQMEELCRPAMGYSFAAGATDGPGVYPFYQAMLEGIPELDDIVEAVFGTFEGLRQCQAPKPVLLPTGLLDDDPFPWQPSIVPVQILRLGDFFLVGVPGEITTMGGRRVHDAVKNTLVANGFPDTIHVVITANANEYASYIVTPEEFQMQRYEGASTIFGPYTLDGYIVTYTELAEALATGAPIAIGDEPPDLRSLQSDALDPILTDATDTGQNYGDVLVDTLPAYQTGETAFASFVAGNPRNDIKTDDTFLEVQRQETDSSWTVVYNDAFWETKFIWLSNCQERPPFCFLPNITGCTPYNISEFKCWEEQFSNATIEWDISANEQPGNYRLVHYGNARTAIGDVVSYSGISSSFGVTVAKGDVIRQHSDAYYVATGEGSHEDIPENIMEFLHLYFGSSISSMSNLF